jgi:hypothetical protein
LRSPPSSWADGPRSELPPGHWNLLAQQVSHRDRTGESEHDLDQAVKLFFALTNAIFDAGCCAWEGVVIARPLPRLVQT